MKPNIHPNYTQASVTCACGNAFTVGSTVPTLHVEICSQCHPFYTGKQKFIDTAGRIDRFKARMKQAEVKKVTKKATISTAEVPETPAVVEEPAEVTPA